MHYGHIPEKDLQPPRRSVLEHRSHLRWCILWEMSAPLLSSAIVYLVLSTPVLLFPDVLPETPWRTEVIAAIAVVGMAIGVVLVREWKAACAALVVFLLSLVVSWAIAWKPWDEVGSLRHFSGVGLGVLAMGVTAQWARTSARLMHAAQIVVLGAVTVLVIGWLGAAVNPNKLTGADTATGAPDLESPTPVLSLRLPGLSPDGLVNSNALGGTALLVLPLCVGVYAAGRLLAHRRGPTLLLAGTASTLAAVVVALSFSRSAWLASGLTALVFLMRRFRGRRWLPALFAAVLVAGLGGAWVIRAASPVAVERAVVAVEETLRWRVMIWQDGLDRVRNAPWLGSGINRVHSGPRTYSTFRIVHFHNVALQVAVDAGLVGLTGYALFFGWIVLAGDRTARRPGEAGHVAAGASLSLVAVHLFGIGDTIALGAKVGLFQWLSAGLILAATRLDR